ncbi:hypothetical protein [Parvularcula dongshanensis]|uniref:Uncharacterized protein n=1 Tax=Parvularcula dongshanensis TaxID=1173995 RepID=A0A840I039_9PROT|nr:hypothetical protein [Parvularcula dongshanensis]MBB4657651.1 hypothetical protein [Parvularcula dongshanensis]
MTDEADEMSVLDEPNPEAEGNRTEVDHGKTYHNMMRFGFASGLPIATGIVMFVILLLLGTNFLVSLFLAFLTWLGVLGFAKTFFVHSGTEGPGH